MKINQGNSQRGAFLILVAFLLPLIMAMLGFVIDFGNVYWHKSVLQNCADASALGGAKAGDVGKEFNKGKADDQWKRELLHRSPDPGQGKTDRIIDYPGCAGTAL